MEIRTGALKLLPPFVDCAIMMASGTPVDANCRHVAYTFPFNGFTAMALPWLVAVPVLIFTRAPPGTPQSLGRLNIKSVGGELALVAARKTGYAKYTVPAAKECWTARFPPLSP